jgi:hypothetical protein
MFTLAIPKSQQRRTLQYLKNNWIDFNEFQKEDTDDGFVNLSFPGKSEEEFKDIVMKLKAQGGTLIGVDSQLTEKKIMKLIDLIEAPLENIDGEKMTEKDVIEQIKEILSSEEADPTSKFWTQIADCIGEFEDQNKSRHPFYEEKKEKVRKVIRKLIRQ